MNGSPVLFDYLIGTCEEGVRNSQPERFGGAFVQNQFKPACLNDGEISRASILQDTINVNRSLPIVFSQITAVRHQSASQNLYPVLVDGWNACLRGKLSNPIAQHSEQEIKL